MINDFPKNFKEAYESKQVQIEHQKIQFLFDELHKYGWLITLECLRLEKLPFRIEGASLFSFLSRLKFGSLKWKGKLSTYEQHTRKKLLTLLDSWPEPSSLILRSRIFVGKKRSISLQALTLELILP